MQTLRVKHLPIIDSGKLLAFSAVLLNELPSIAT
jgi:hypothetical protein